MERVLKATPLAIGAGEVEVAGVNAKRLGFFWNYQMIEEREEGILTDKVVIKYQTNVNVYLQR